jgi:NSS family neurotransmitter:Na+ symporter
MSNNQSTTWRSQSGYIWSLIGSAVGFANILSFSAQAYKNGGGAFLIPYVMALFILGIPMLILEGIIGFRWKMPVVAAYGKVWGGAGKMMGWLAVIACLTIGGFYIVLTGYSVAYTYFAAANLIPEDSKTFFLNSFLKITPNVEEFGQLSLPIFFATFSVAMGTWFVLVRNVRDGIERICSIFMPLLALIMVVFAIVISFLPGGLSGWTYYLTPDFAKLLNPSLWRDVFGQLFFSLSLGLGIIIGYSRHTGEEINIPRAMLAMALGDFAVSFIAGFAIFGCLAHISYVQGVPFESILTTDSTFDIGFILFPKILMFFGSPLSQIVGVIFFFCIFIAGITGVFSIVESIAGNIEVEFKVSRRFSVSITLTFLTVLGLIFCMGNAPHIIDALVPMVLGTNMLIGGLALIFAFQYGCRELWKDPVWSQSAELRFFSFSLRYIAPIFLACILCGNLWQEFQHLDFAKEIRWAWFVVALVASGFLSWRTQRARRIA